LPRRVIAVLTGTRSYFLRSAALLYDLINPDTGLRNIVHFP
jgi:hypothetical protein